MTDLLDTVRGTVQNACLVSGPLKKEGCSVSLKDAPPRRLIVDFDKPGSPLDASMTRCDYLLIADDADDADDSDWVVPVELKKGRLDASEAVKQLRAGANAARKLVPKGSKVNFRPVVAAGGNKAERNKLKDKRNWVRFRDHAEYVRLLKCGDQLINAFKVTQI